MGAGSVYSAPVCGAYTLWYTQEEATRVRKTPKINNAFTDNRDGGSRGKEESGEGRRAEEVDDR